MKEDLNQKIENLKKGVEQNDVISLLSETLAVKGYINMEVFADCSGNATVVCRKIANRKEGNPVLFTVALPTSETVILLAGLIKRAYGSPARVKPLRVNK